MEQTCDRLKVESADEHVDENKNDDLDQLAMLIKMVPSEAWCSRPKRELRPLVACMRDESMNGPLS